MPRLSRVQVALACETAARLTRFSKAPDAPMATLPAELTAPLMGATKLAWTNGQTFFAPVTPVPVRSAHPRSRAVHLDASARVH